MHRGRASPRLLGLYVDIVGHPGTLTLVGSVRYQPGRPCNNQSGKDQNKGDHLALPWPFSIA